MTEVMAGIDIGGTNTVFGLVDREGNILAEGHMSTAVYDEVEDYLEALAAHVLALVASADPPVALQGVGVGGPNGHYFSGTIEDAPNLPWKGTLEVADLLSEHTGVPVVLTNDANAAAMGEMLYGAAEGMKDFVVVTLGTGLGSGYVVDGKVMYGWSGFAGELGHVIVKENGRLCGCGRRGCLETYVSAPGLVRTVMEMLGDAPRGSSLRGIPMSEMTARNVTEAAQAGDAVARDAFSSTGHILGLALANTIAITSPQAIILFGGLAQAGRLILEPTLKTMETMTLSNLKGSTRLLLSALMQRNAAVLGAAALAWDDMGKKA
ncbi:MAG: ROK family protein [Bacteroidetes bacterium]|nr:ROK family protein [Bacteroidota bacterium]